MKTTEKTVNEPKTEGRICAVAVPDAQAALDAGRGIVERLRWLNEQRNGSMVDADDEVFQIIAEAAAEIGRLQADNRLLQEDLDRCRAFYEAWMTARRTLEGK